MAWFNSILGNPTVPNQYMGQQNIASSTSTALGTSLASAQAGSIMAVNNSMLANSYASSGISAHQSKMYAVKQYADAIGWDLTHHHLPVGMTSDDPKIAMLKLTNVGEVLKDVGVRTSDTDYYVMREPSV